MFEGLVGGMGTGGVYESVTENFNFRWMGLDFIMLWRC